MAKRISDEEIKLSIIINGDPAQKEINDLEKETIKFKQELKSLEKQQKSLERQRKTDSEQYKNNAAEIKRLSNVINENETKLKGLVGALNLNQLTMDQLRAKANLLAATLKHLAPGTEDFKKYNADLKAVTARMDELRGKAQGTKWSIGGMADTFNRYSAIGVSIIAMLTGVVLSIQKIISANGALARAQTNVQKTTGMTKREVDELTKSFGLLKTATTRIDLLKIAEIGGRLGIPKAEIQDFVKVMDKSAVALGDSFEGGPEVVAEKLGRIKGLYEELKNVGVEEAFEGVGSALNDLGAAGTASEQNVAEFAQRVGTLPGKLKPSIATALGLGAAFEESGLKAELAGNNYGKLISVAARDTPAFAKVMGRSVKELEALINTDPTEFFLQFAQSLKGLDPTDLAKVLDYLKLNDNEVKMVLGAASDNVDLFREKIALAGQSMATATSLTNEYNLKNADLQAVLDRVKKKMMGWFTSDSLVSFLEAGVNWFAKFIGAVEDTDGEVAAWKNTLVFSAKVLAVVTAALVTNVGWLKLCALWEGRNTKETLLYNIAAKARAVADGISTVASKGFSAVMSLCRGNIKGATGALNEMTTAMKTTPWGLVLSMLATVIAAYVAFSETTSKATRQQNIFNSVANEAQSQLRQETEVLNERLQVAQNVFRSDVERKKALEDIIALQPDMLEGLTLENVTTAEGKKILDQYTESLEKSARAKAVSAKITELHGKLLDIENSGLKDNITMWEELWNVMKSGGSITAAASLNLVTSAKNKNEAKQEIEEVMKKLLEEQAAAYSDSVKVLSPFDKKLKEINDELLILAGLHMQETKRYRELLKMRDDLLKKKSVNIPDAGAEKEAAAKAKKLADLEKKWADEERKQNIENAKKLAEEITSLKQRIIDEQLAQKQDGFDKERSLEAENHRRKLTDLKKQLVDESVITNLDAKIDDPATKVMDRAYLMHYKEELLQKNKDLNQLIELEEKRFNLKMDTINLNEDTDRIRKIQESYDRELVLRQTLHNTALAALGGNELAKQALQDKFDAAEIEHQREHLEKLIAEKELLLADLQQMDFSLLTPEQQTSMQDEIDQLKLKISELLKAKADLQNKTGSNDFGTAARQAFGDADILGFTADQWDLTFRSLDSLKEKLLAVNMVIGALQNIWGAYNNYVTANENAQLRKFENNANAKKKKLKWQLDNGYINQSQYTKQLEILDKELDVKRQDLEYKQAKRQRDTAIADAIANTAKGVTAALSLTPPYSFIMAALTGAMGALQVATIRKQPLPARGYEEGLYPDEVMRQQDGKRFKATYRGRTRSGMVNRPEYFLAGENGPEMVIDAAAYRQMPPETKALLINYLRGVKGVPGYESGKYNTDVTGGQRYEVPSSGTDATAIMLQQAMALIAANTAVLDKIQKEGISAWVDRDYRNIKDLRERLEKEKGSRDKAKQ